MELTVTLDVIPVAVTTTSSPVPDMTPDFVVNQTWKRPVRFWKTRTRGRETEESKTVEVLTWNLKNSVVAVLKTKNITNPFPPRGTVNSRLAKRTLSRAWPGWTMFGESRSKLKFFLVLPCSFNLNGTVGVEKDAEKWAPLFPTEWTELTFKTLLSLLRIPSFNDVPRILFAALTIKMTWAEWPVSVNRKKNSLSLVYHYLPFRCVW